MTNCEHLPGAWYDSNTRRPEGLFNFFWHRLVVLFIAAIALANVSPSLAADSITSLPFYTTIVDDGMYNATPGIVILPNGDYLLTYNKATCHVCKSISLVRRSTDHGLTWGPEQVVFDRSAGIDPMLLLTPDGILRIYFNKVHTPTNEIGFSYLTSTDFGVTWPTTPVFMQDPPSKLIAGDNFVTVGNTIYFAAYGTDPATSATGAYLFTSTDNAQTWNRASTIAPVGSEISIAYLGGITNFVTIMRDTTSSKTFKMTSSDMGQTWSAPIDITSQVGVLQFPVLTWVGNTLVLTARQFVSNADGTMVVYFSTDNGATFGNARIIEDYLGDAIDGAYSAAIALNDNVAYIVYYADEHGLRRPAIRSVILQVEPRSVVIGAGMLATQTSDSAVLPTITFDGGTLQPTAPLNFTVPVFLNAGGGIVDTSLADTIISGAMSGSGSLTKNGIGTLTSSGTSAHTGATIVNAGTLLINGDISASAGVTVNTGAILGGSGVVPSTTVMSDGVLSPGSSIGTLKIAGNLTFNDAANIYRVEVLPSQADQLNASGTATLKGIMQVTAQGGTYHAGSYTILHTTGGISGQFTSLAVNGSFGPGLDPHLVYGAQDVYLVLGPDAVYPTATTLQTSRNPTAFGQSVTFTATVTSGGGTPNGTVTFLDDTTQLGTGALSNGVAKLQTAGLASGAHTITAVYAGNSLFSSSTSSMVTQTVNPAPTRTVVASSSPTSTYGKSVTFTATVTSNGGTPLGQVTFKDGSTPLGIGTLASGKATVTTASLAIGEHTITAAYAGGGNFAFSTGTRQQTVNKAVTTTRVAAKPNPALPGRSVVFTATVAVAAPGTGTAGGTVTFKEGTKTLGTANLSSGKANFTASGLLIGKHTITASYSGSSNFAASSGTATSLVDPRVRPEFRVNTWVANSQQQPSIVRLTGGSFVVAWQSNGQDGSGFGIYAQRYTATGVRLGQEFRVNTTTPSDQSAPSVGALSDGGFVVTWQSNGEDGSGVGIYGQRYSAGATPVGKAFRVNTTTANHQSQPASAGLVGGGFVTTWASNGQDGSGLGIYSQRYASTGAASGPEFRVNSTVTNDQSRPAVAALAGGGFVVTYQSGGQDGSGLGIYGQRYTAMGARVGSAFRVNKTTINDQSLPSVAGLSDGGFVVMWQSNGQDGSGLGVYGQRYNSSGGRVGVEFRVNTRTASNQSDPSVAAFADGGFVVTWTSSAQEGAGLGVYAQCYNAAGKPVDLEFRVNTTTAKNQWQPSIAAFSAGKFVAIWTSQDQDGSLEGVYGQRFEMDNVAAAAAQTGGYKSVSLGR